MLTLVTVLNAIVIVLLLVLIALHIIDRQPDLFDICDCSAYDGHEPHCAVFDAYPDIDKDEEGEEH